MILALCTLGFNRADPAEDALLLALTVSVIYQVYRMYPYTPLSRRQVFNAGQHDPDRIFSILVSNIYRKNRDADRFIELVESTSPDIICVLEPDEWWESKLSALEWDYPFSNRHISNDGYGMIFLSKLKTVSSEVNYIVSDNVPSIHSILELPSGERIEFYCLHPDPPTPSIPRTRTRGMRSCLL